MIEQVIADAIEDVRSAPNELNEIASEYGIKPEVLRARFERSFGSVETYEARQIACQEQAAIAEGKFYLARRNEEDVMKDVMAFLKQSGYSFPDNYTIQLAA